MEDAQSEHNITQHEQSGGEQSGDDQPFDNTQEDADLVGDDLDDERAGQATCFLAATVTASIVAAVTAAGGKICVACGTKGQLCI